MSGVCTWAKLTADRVTYYSNSVADGKESYYSGKGESPGAWLGEGARMLGLAGELSDGELARMASGQHPVTGEMLRNGNGLPTGQRRCEALDFTFNAPKTVSLLYASGDRDLSARLLDAHERAVRAAVRTLEAEMAIVRRGKTGSPQERQYRAAGVLAAAYRHRTSRSGDAQLHTHVVVANMAPGPDGRWTALLTKNLPSYKMALGAVYAAELRANCAELGLTWLPLNGKGLAELDCIDRTTLRRFSNRRVEIERAANGSQDRAAAMAGAALATRRAKREVDWQAIQREVSAALAPELLDAVRARTEQDGNHHLNGRVELERLAGPDGLTQMTNTFSRSDVIIAVARDQPQGMHREQVFRHVDAFLTRADVIDLSNGRYTTTDLLEAESARERAQLGRAESRVGLATERALRRGMRGLTLNDGQRAVLEAVFTSGNGVDLVQAQAGTGKTYTARAIRRVAEEDGRRVLGTAPTARAARELSSQAGIDSDTLDALLGKLDRDEITLSWKDVIVVDEAGMVGTRPGARLERHAEQAGAKLIEIGDRRQLQSVLAGGDVPGAWERLGGVRLTEVVRQRDPEERRALGQLHAGNVEVYVRFAEQRNRISYGAELRQAVEHYSTNVAKLGHAQVALVCPTNALARAANDLVREQRRGAGELGKDTTIGELDISVGDRVVCRRNDRRCDVINSDRGTVTLITGAGLDVELDDGRLRHLPRSYAEAGDLQLGYAGTVHVHQGCTVERTIVAAQADELYGELAYVAASRARDTTHFHLLDDPRPGDLDRAEIGPVSEECVRDQREVLIAAMGKSHAEELASEMLMLTQERRRDLGREL